MDEVSPEPGDKVDGPQGFVNGRSEPGESGGGAYPNPHTGKVPRGSGFMGHGGQTNIGYHGGPQAGYHGASSPNATTRGEDDFSGQGQTGPKIGKG